MSQECFTKLKAVREKGTYIQRKVPKIHSKSIKGDSEPEENEGLKHKNSIKLTHH